MKKNVKNRGLGRGLDALLSDSPTQDVLASSSSIPISKIKPSRFQPRTHFDPEELKSLTESIRNDGVLMPILVRPSGSEFELIAGERRWRASQAAGLLEIPAVVRDVSDQQALEMAIIENEQRDNLTAIESARAYQRLMNEFAYTQQQVAERIGVSRVQVSNMIRLIQLPERVQVMIENREIGMGHARPLVGLPPAIAESLAHRCSTEGWSARQAEKEARKASTQKDTLKSKAEQDADVAALQEELTRKLGLQVSLSCRKNGSGELKITYTRPQELDGVLKRLRHPA